MGCSSGAALPFPSTFLSDCVEGDYEADRRYEVAQAMEYDRYIDVLLPPRHVCGGKEYEDPKQVVERKPQMVEGEQHRHDHGGPFPEPADPCGKIPPEEQLLDYRPNNDIECDEADAGCQHHTLRIVPQVLQVVPIEIGGNTAV